MVDKIAELDIRVEIVESALFECQQKLDTEVVLCNKALARVGNDREHLTSSLVKMYKIGFKHSIFVAELCDEHLDRSGELLGIVRERARVNHDK